MLSAVIAELDISIEAVAAFGTMRLAAGTAFAESAHLADVLVAVEAQSAVDVVFGCCGLHTFVADGVFNAGVAYDVQFLSCHNHAVAAYFAGQFGAVCTV